MNTLSASLSHRRIDSCVYALLLAFASIPMSYAQQQRELTRAPVEQTTTLVFENDIFTGQDSGYTNGLALIFAKGTFPHFTPDTVPGVVARAIRGSWISRDDGRERARVYTVAQGMQTPEDISIQTLQEDQLPYAGLLVGGLSLYAFDSRVADQLSLFVGVVGPWSLAEPSQKLIHTVTGSDDPAGWDNQLDNEIVFQLAADRGYRLTEGRVGRSVEVDLIALGGLAVGTIASHATATLIVRLGQGLRQTFPVASFLPNRQTNVNMLSPGKNWYGFIGAQSAFIANDIQVDGNTFTDSHSIKLDHTRERLSAGVSFSIGDIGLTFLYADVPGNNSEDAFGAVSITYKH